MVTTMTERDRARLSPIGRTAHGPCTSELFQAERPITPGNTLDRIHAQYLVGFDRVVTADADFYDALVFVTQRLKVRGSPVFIKRPAGGSSLAELKAAI